MTLTLPDSKQFVAEALEGEMEAARARQEQALRAVDEAEQAQKVIQSAGVSEEFLSLLVQYCSQMIQAQELSELDWRGLAKRLGTAPEFLKEAAESCNRNDVLWNKVVHDRIKRAHGAKVFRDAGWERLESLALNRLTELAEKKLIKDTGELLAIATHARRATESKQNGGNVGGTTINLNMGVDSMDGTNGLPAAGTTMKLDLTPRLAQSLQARQQRPEGRVIDGQMLSANELRAALDSTTKIQDAEVETVSERDVFEGEGHE